jgi:8-oxo-dGTP pyrophosphatase MutT (NUDIX family)
VRYPLPASLRGSALAYQSGEQVAVAAKDAATVVLVRDAEVGVECYLLRRRTSMAFAAGMYVFPGGGVDTRDAGTVAWAGPSAAEWGERLSCAPALAQALVCAAVRETFEEAGVLLAGPDAEQVVDVSAPEWEVDRAALVRGSSSLNDVLSRRGLVLRSDLLAAWTHWITPAFEPRRYDTRFFVAALPPRQRARDVSTESDRVAWMTPADALAGGVALMPPTRVTLAEVAGYRSVTELIGAAHDRAITPIEPRAVRDGDELWLEVDLP